MLDMIDVSNTIESLVTDFPPVTPESQTERELGGQISSLWSAHVGAKNTAKATKDELRSIRAKLGEQLSEMKQILAKPGCDGQWSGFLREHKIPRATADRLVIRYQKSLNPDSNCVTEEVSEPTSEDVRRLFAAVWPKLRRTLRSQQSILLFVDLLTSHSEAMNQGIPAVIPATPTNCSAHSDGDSIIKSESCPVLPPEPDQEVIFAP